jgi:hypothetical protein
LSAVEEVQHKEPPLMEVAEAVAAVLSAHNLLI